MTFNSLVDEVMSTINRTDVATRAEVEQNFIYEAHQQICRECKNLGLVAYSISAFNPNNYVIQKPDRWRKTLNINCATTVGGSVINQLEERSYDFCRMYWPNPVLTGLPLYYADYGFSNIIVAPTPDAAYQFEFGYLEMPQPITAINQTNWLTNYAPDVLKYAVLLQCVAYIKNFDIIAVWQSAYSAGIESLRNQDVSRYVARTSDRSGD